MTDQFSLFDCAPAVAAVKAPAVSAHTKPSHLAKLRQLAESAEQDLADCESNLAMIDMHIEAGRLGRVDGNWYQGGVQNGCYPADWISDREDGRYSVRINHWLRHLRCTLHAERRDILLNLIELRGRVAKLAALMGGAA